MKYQGTTETYRIPDKIHRDLAKVMGETINQVFPLAPRYHCSHASGQVPMHRDLPYTIDPKAPSGCEIQFTNLEGNVLHTYNQNDGQLTAAQWRDLHHECRKRASLLLSYKIKWLPGHIVNRPESFVRVYLHVRSSKNCRATVIDDLESYKEIRSLPQQLIPTREIRDNPV